jgi:putative SOS response-associated peptidase YedK
MRSPVLRVAPGIRAHVAQGGRRYRFALADGDWFYLAGIWQPGGQDWPESYAILTVAANPEVVRYQERQGAVLLRQQRMDWLDAMNPKAASGHGAGGWLLP